MEDLKIAVIGLGYVGLPLAVEFGKKLPVLGYDINAARIQELNNGIDRTKELTKFEITEGKFVKYSNDSSELKDCNFFIITVPTPVDKNKRPDMRPLMDASTIVGRHLKKNDIVVYESTVYPGATENDCVPVLEESSGLKFNRDFFVGYSPERINPGDKNRKLKDIMKVTSGSTPEVARRIDNIYRQIIAAGTYLAPSIKIAEASKIIENTQRDLNIALINELALIFSIMGIDTSSVLEAAGTKWNFMNFRPGLVGGHCIGVDPYYLTFMAESIGYHPEIILAGRRLNDKMGAHVVNQFIKKIIEKEINVYRSRILIMGLTFKENCSDIRNTKVVDIIKELRDYKCEIDVYDPLVSISQVREEYNLTMIEKPHMNYYDGVIIAVSHNEFIKIGIIGIRKFLRKNGIIYDLKSVFPMNSVDLRL